MSLHLLVLLLPWLAFWRPTRRLTLGVLGCDLLLAFGLLEQGTPTADELSLTLLPYTCMIYLVLVLATPLKQRQAGSTRALLAGLGLDLWFFSIQSPLWLALAWPLTHLPLWLQLPRCSWTRRLALTFWLPGCLSFAVGCWGYLGSGAPPLWAMLALLGAVALRKAIFPVHQWLPALFERASLPHLIAFCCPQVGAYATVRLLTAQAPEPLLVALGTLALFTSLYGAILALGNRSLRGVYASLFMGQTSLVYAGLQCTTPAGLAGGLAVWVAGGLALTGLGMAIWVLEARRGRQWLDTYQGGYDRSPVLAGTFLLLGLTSVGFPGTLGFVSQELLLDGTLEHYPQVGVLAAFTACLNGITVMATYFRLFCGSRQEYGYSQSIRRRERLAVYMLLAVLLGMGLAPQNFLASRARIANQLLRARALLITPQAE